MGMTRYTVGHVDLPKIEVKVRGLKVSRVTCQLEKMRGVRYNREAARYMVEGWIDGVKRTTWKVCPSCVDDAIDDLGGDVANVQDCRGRR